jgi:hypothetical protein
VRHAEPLANNEQTTSELVVFYCFSPWKGMEMGAFQLISASVSLNIKPTREGGIINGGVKYWPSSTNFLIGPEKRLKICIETFCALDAFNYYLLR